MFLFVRPVLLVGIQSTNNIGVHVCLCVDCSDVSLTVVPTFVHFDRNLGISGCSCWYVVLLIL